MINLGTKRSISLVKEFWITFWQTFFLGIGLIFSAFFSFQSDWLLMIFLLMTFFLIKIGKKSEWNLFLIFLFFIPFDNFKIFSYKNIDLSLLQLTAIILFLVLILKWFKKKLTWNLDFSLIDLFSLFSVKKEYSLELENEKSFKQTDQLIFFLMIISFLSAFLNHFYFKNALRGALIISSFVLIFWLFRNFLNNFKKSFYQKEIAVFVFLSSFFILLNGLIQAFLIKIGKNQFVAMPERINSFFAEPDWFGIYLSLLLGFALIIWNYFWIEEKEFFLKIGSFSLRKIELFVIFFWISLIFFELILTVARSAWLGALAVILVFFFWEILRLIFKKISLEVFFKKNFFLVSSFILAVLVAIGGNFSKFHFINRAESSFSGWQRITISCPKGKEIPLKIKQMEELINFDCYYIRLEEIEIEKEKDRQVREILRPDPNISIRKQIYQKAFSLIKERFWQGWGVKGADALLGKDKEGNYFNASNLFLDGFLSWGVLGGVILIFIWFIILGEKFFQVTKSIIKDDKKESNLKEEMVVLVAIGFLVPNFFNSSLLSSFFWLILTFLI